MKFSDGERLIIVMMAEIMETMKLNEELDPSLIKRLAINHDEWAIGQHYSGIFASEAPNDDDVKETADILWMWGIIEHAIGKLKGDEAEEAKGWRWTEFRGFDGNNDAHYGIACTLIHDLGNFQGFKDRNLNSHSQATLHRYQVMYEKFDRYVSGNSGAQLSASTLRDLCN